MQVIMGPEQRAPIKAWIDGVELEDAARQQLVNVAKLPFIHHHVAVMPDVHWGMGATVGSVIATRGAVVPAAVGVDIGCGMIAQRTNLRAEDLPDDLRGVRSAIEAAIPHGRTDNGQANDKGAWSAMPRDVEDVAAALKDGLEAVRATGGDRLASWWTNERAFRHLGTLGTGNHFVEVCLDEAGAVWVMLHSGSRGIGNAIGTTFIERAKKLAEQYFIPLPDPGHGAMTEQRMAEIQARLDAITPGVREVECSASRFSVVAYLGGVIAGGAGRELLSTEWDAPLFVGHEPHADAEFAAYGPADVRDLLAALRRVFEMADHLDGPDCGWVCIKPVTIAEMIRAVISGDTSAYL